MLTSGVGESRFAGAFHFCRVDPLQTATIDFEMLLPLRTESGGFAVGSVGCRQ